MNNILQQEGVINFDKTTYSPKCIYCNMANKGYYHWTHSLIYTKEMKEALCKCKELEI